MAFICGGGITFCWDYGNSCEDWCTEYRFLVSIGFAYVVFGEKLTRKSATGLAMIVAGTLGMII